MSMSVDSDNISFPSRLRNFCYNSYATGGETLHKELTAMKQDSLSEYCEFESLSQMLLVAEKDDYIKFLRFCEEHLRKGEQVQAIWSDYQDQEK